MSTLNTQTFVPGDIVVSLAGHDKNNLYLVHSIDKNGFLVIIDGRYHKIGEPKLKNPKHCSKLAHDENILAKSNLPTVTNAEIYKQIKSYQIKEKHV